MSNQELVEIINGEFKKLYHYLDVNFQEVHASLNRLEDRIEDMAMKVKK